MRTTKRAFVAVIAIIFVIVVLVEAVHFARHGHLVNYGWHVDVISENADFGIRGITNVQFAKVTNFTAIPGSMESCIVDTDTEPFRTEVFPVRIQKLDSSGRWSTWPPVIHLDHMDCQPERTASVRLWPFQSVETQRGALAAIDGYHRGDLLRLVVVTGYSSRSGHLRAITSPPFQLMEERERLK